MSWKDGSEVTILVYTCSQMQTHTHTHTNKHEVTKLPLDLGGGTFL